MRLAAASADQTSKRGPASSSASPCLHLSRRLGSPSPAPEHATLAAQGTFRRRRAVGGHTAPAEPSRDREAGMRVIVGVLGIIVGLLAAVVGTLLCYVELFGERPDWVALVIGVIMLLVGVGGIWAGLNRAIRAIRGSHLGRS